jgi:dihydropteroate synthase
MTLVPPLPTAPAPTAIALDQLDAETASCLRLRPVGLLTGSAAMAAMANGVALPLAGGDTVFTLVEVLARTTNGIVAALAPLHRLRLWASEQSADQRERIEIQLSRLSATRERWAGLALDRPLVMGIVNVTPDSFFVGTGEDSEKAVALGRSMLEAGADILDIGGESTRPGAAAVPQDEEMRRLEPVVRALANTGAAISVDTRKAAVMEAALTWGARAVNDVSALEGQGSLDMIARSNAAVILMHMRGEPGTMQQGPSYDLASLDIADYLAARIAVCIAAGLPPHRIVIDPGIGFGKTVEHNLEVLGRLTLFHALGCGVLVGLSRKSTIGRVSGGAPVEARLPGSIAGALQALRQGVQILRVHDIAETRQAIAVWQAIAHGA